MNIKLLLMLIGFCAISCHQTIAESDQGAGVLEDSNEPSEDEGPDTLSDENEDETNLSSQNDNSDSPVLEDESDFRFKGKDPMNPVARNVENQERNSDDENQDDQSNDDDNLEDSIEPSEDESPDTLSDENEDETNLSSQNDNSDSPVLEDESDFRFKG